VLLVIEVADTSLQDDRTVTLRLDARAASGVLDRRREHRDAGGVPVTVRRAIRGRAPSRARRTRGAVAFPETSFPVDATFV
jgi:hypothetical protein